MSYDIELHRRNGDVVYADTPFLMHGGTVPAYVDEHDVLRRATQREAHVNITYNYARYYYDATEGDVRFEQGSGIRGLYGKTAGRRIYSDARRYDTAHRCEVPQRGRYVDGYDA